MSYILDALRKADSERERGAIPGLHAQLGYAERAAGRAKHWWAHPGVWVGAGLLGGLAVAAGAVWIFSGLSPTAPTASAPVLPYVAPAAARVPVEPPPLPALSADPAPAAPTPPATAPLESVVHSPPLAIRHAPPLTALPTQPLSSKPQPQPSEPRQPVAAPVTQAAERVYTVDELPANIQAQLPQLVIGGASYSQAPASRLVILNGQVFHEGEQVVAGLTLEKIQTKSVILSFKGYRYAVAY